MDKKVGCPLPYRQCIKRISIIPLRELRRLDLNLLVVLHTVLETQNVTAAARRLNMSQPAVSRALARLRSVFSDPLFVKGAKGVIPTPRAQTLQAPMKVLLAELGQVLGQARFDPATSTRVFKIATTDYGALAVLSPIVGRLLHEAPTIRLDIVALNATTFRDLGSPELDLALYSDDDTPVPLLSKPLFDETYISLVRTGHPTLADAEIGQLSLDAFLAHRHILVTIGGDDFGVVDAALAELGHSREIAVTLPYFSTAALIAAQSDLLLTLPSRVALAFDGTHDLTIVRPPVSIERFGYRLLWHTRTDADPGCCWLRKRIVELAGRS